MLQEAHSLFLQMPPLLFKVPIEVLLVVVRQTVREAVALRPEDAVEAPLHEEMRICRTVHLHLHSKVSCMNCPSAIVVDAVVLHLVEGQPTAVATKTWILATLPTKTSTPTAVAMAHLVDAVARQTAAASSRRT